MILDKIIMSIYNYLFVPRIFNKFVQNTQTVLKIQKCSTASVLDTNNFSLAKYKAVKNEDHFIISDETTGGHFEVTFAWLRDHCRLTIFFFTKMSIF